MSRPSVDRTMLDVALVLARRSTCVKAAVGCVLCDRRGRVLSTGYNGVARGQPHCNEVETIRRAWPCQWRDVNRAVACVVAELGSEAESAEGMQNPRLSSDRRVLTWERLASPCAGAFAPPGSDLCEAVHAEANALLQCRDPDRVHTAYCTTSPCMRCAKELLNTGVQRVVYGKRYESEPQALDLLTRGGVELVFLGEQSVQSTTDPQ